MLCFLLTITMSFCYIQRTRINIQLAERFYCTCMSSVIKSYRQLKPQCVVLYTKHAELKQFYFHRHKSCDWIITEAPEVLNCGSVEYRAKGIFMDRYDGDQLFETLGLKIRSGASLDELERMQLAFLPLMKSLTLSKSERLRQSNWLA